MIKKSLTLSIVIPAYNEEHHLKSCLEAIAAQTDKPDQVIVVDNNSTDRTVQIARSFPFVSLATEKRQGQRFAQVTGFDLVTSDIIGRIDGDSILPPDWVRQVKATFAAPEVVAFTGAPRPYDLPLKRLAVAVFQFYHDYATPLIAGHRLLYGSNCAFRRRAWPEVKPRLHLGPYLWEDYDLGFALAPQGKIVWVPQNVVGCAFRKFNEPFWPQMRYYWGAVRAFGASTSWWRTGLQGVLRASIALSFPLMLVSRMLARSRVRDLK